MQTYDQITTLIESQKAIEHIEDPEGVSLFTPIYQMQLFLVLGDKEKYFDSLGSLISKPNLQEGLQNSFIQHALAKTLSFRVELDWGPLSSDEFDLFSSVVDREPELSQLSEVLILGSFLFANGQVEALGSINQKLYSQIEGIKPKSISTEQLRIFVCAQMHLWEAKLAGTASSRSTAMDCVELRTTEKIRTRRLNYSRTPKDLVLARTQLALAEVYLLESIATKDLAKKEEFLKYGLLSLDTVRSYIDSFDHPGLWKKRLRLITQIYDARIELVPKSNPEKAARLSKLRDLAYSQGLLL